VTSSSARQPSTASLRRIRHGTKGPAGTWFDAREADRVVRFIETLCRHAKGEWAGQLLKLERWQKERIIRPLFGWKRPDGTRRYRKAYIEVARKNAKSTLGAALAVYLTTSDGEDGAEVYSAAADRDQAAIIFEIARFMVEHEPALSDRCRVFRRSIVYPATASRYEVLSADVPTKHGKNAHAILFDELHAQPNRELYDVLNTSTGARRQPLMVMMTTAGFDRNSVCWETHDYAQKVLDGTVDDPYFLPVIYAADREDDWTDPRVWAKANPNMGVSIKRQYLVEECKRAQESPAYENTFRRLHLNQWTEQSVRWMPMEDWRACGAAVSEAALLGRPCYTGLDLASTMDLTAMVHVFPDDAGGYDILPRFWVPEETLEARTQRDLGLYRQWVAAGWLRTTPGNVTDYGFIRRDLLEDASKFQIQQIGYDPWNATQTAIELSEGDGLPMVEVRQGWRSMNEPLKELLRLVRSRQIRHGAHPVLDWMAGNMVVKTDPSGNIRPDKQKSTEKIDGMVALTMALGRSMATGDQRSIYEAEELLVL
jgi:phage terminase large subunit-like protein